MQFATRAIHSAQPSDPATGALIAPIYQTSTFEQESPGVNLGFDYSRTNNPTRQRLEPHCTETDDQLRRDGVVRARGVDRGGDGAAAGCRPASSTQAI